MRERGGLFTSDLSVNEFLLVREAGFRPVGLVLGSSVYHVGLQVARWGRNMEMDRLTQAMYHARELAMTRMEAEARRARGRRHRRRTARDRLQGVRQRPRRVRRHRYRGRGRRAAGRRVGTWRNNRGLPFTSDLSGQDFWTLIQAGYAPLGMVMGTCVYHIAHRGPLSALQNMGTNVEIAQYTEALYDARELAMSRMQAEAEALHAEGIVGVQLLSLPHRWGGHTTEFFAIGTAVRPLREDHVIATPQLVLPLTDGGRW